MFRLISKSAYSVNVCYVKRYGNQINKFSSNLFMKVKFSENFLQTGYNYQIMVQRGLTINVIEQSFAFNSVRKNCLAHTQVCFRVNPLIQQ